MTRPDAAAARGWIIRGSGGRSRAGIPAHHRAGVLLPAYALASLPARRPRTASNLWRTRDSALLPAPADTERIWRNSYGVRIGGGGAPICQFGAPPGGYARCLREPGASWLVIPAPTAVRRSAWSASSN